MPLMLLLPGVLSLRLCSLAKSCERCWELGRLAPNGCTGRADATLYVRSPEFGKGGGRVRVIQLLD